MNFLEKMGHDQLFCKTQYAKGLVQDRHFLPKCNAWSKLPILLSEGKIKEIDFENTKTEGFCRKRSLQFLFCFIRGFTSCNSLQ
jgi:hypothetical protein